MLGRPAAIMRARCRPTLVSRRSSPSPHLLSPTPQAWPLTRLAAPLTGLAAAAALPFGLALTALFLMSLSFERSFGSLSSSSDSDSTTISSSCGRPQLVSTTAAKIPTRVLGTHVDILLVGLGSGGDLLEVDGNRLVDGDRVVLLVVAAAQEEGELVKKPGERVGRCQKGGTHLRVKAALVADEICLRMSSSRREPTPSSTIESQSSLLRKYSSIKSMTSSTADCCGA